MIHVDKLIVLAGAGGALARAWVQPRNALGCGADELAQTAMLMRLLEVLICATRRVSAVDRNNGVGPEILNHVRMLRHAECVLLRNFYESLLDSLSTTFTHSSK